MCIKSESEYIKKMTIPTELGSSTHSNTGNGLVNNKTLYVNCFFAKSLPIFNIRTNGSHDTQYVVTLKKLSHTFQRKKSAPYDTVAVFK